MQIAELKTTMITDNYPHLTNALDKRLIHPIVRKYYINDNTDYNL